MKMTKKTLLRLLANPHDINFRNMIANDTVTLWHAAASNASLLEMRLDSDPWRMPGNHVIKHGSDQQLVDLYFTLNETYAQLERTIKHLDKIKDTHETTTGTEER
ncbi:MULTISPECIES: hypothetical protein [Actinotignum]|uniref:Uncharacterized protein n=1 Tax=Actinotignum schaalii FB123-CNA-2 TaxID=883067 RepID=S2VN82_9ACTO|nr:MULTISPECIES: hypothetical protein [Actinotignum]EPD27495.1 hypothetical protein HMPREF9237_00582 [Actinotignum schaalii FB123-CNA-2]MDY5128097.1 hypothetical protein [Actinotignum sp. SLA_B059]MDY5136394.1 hypothetical protein [Actinotignum sanguinis]MDY5138686.1 hypothetical protein [Actinotignum timonense]